MDRFQVSVNITRINPSASVTSPDTTILPSLTQSELWAILAAKVVLDRRDQTTKPLSSGRVGFYGSAKVDLG